MLLRGLDYGSKCKILPTSISTDTQIFMPQRNGPNQLQDTLVAGLLGFSSIFEEFSQLPSSHFVYFDAKLTLT